MPSVWTVQGLDPNAPIESALALILRRRFAEMWSFARTAASGPGVDAVHDMRVGARRVLGIMRLFRGAFAPADFRKHERTLAALIKTLGKVRDHDVNILAVRKFRKTLSVEEGKALSVLLIRENAARGERAKVLAREAKKLRAAAYDKAAEKFFDSLTSPVSAARTTLKRSGNLREETRRRVPALFGELEGHAARIAAGPADSEELHQMRLSGKPLRYLMEASAQAFGEQYSACLAEIKMFLDAAGTIHDCDVLTAMLESFLKSWDGSKPENPASWRTASRAGIVKFIRYEKALRRQKFAALTRMMERWRREEFSRKLLKSVALPDAHSFRRDAGERAHLFLAES